MGTCSSTQTCSGNGEIGMGICASSQIKITRIGGERGGREMSSTLSATGKIIHINGKLEEFKKPIRAKNIISQNPNCFLCSSESMYLNSYLAQVPDEEELQVGQIYFLVPISMSTTPLSLSNLCTLAIKASTALSKHHMNLSSGNRFPVDVNVVRVVAATSMSSD